MKIRQTLIAAALLAVCGCSSLPHEELSPARITIAELEAPAPEVINAYAKFAGDNSAMERAAKARGRAAALRTLLEELQDGSDPR